MTAPAYLLQCGLIASLATVAAVVVMDLLNGRIRLRGLTSDDVSGMVRADRLQMFVVSIGIAATYLGAALETGGFPEVPEWALMIVGGSHGIYLTGKQLRSR